MPLIPFILLFPSRNEPFETWPIKRLSIAAGLCLSKKETVKTPAMGNRRGLTRWFTHVTENYSVFVLSKTFINTAEFSHLNAQLPPHLSFLLSYSMEVLAANVTFLAGAAFAVYHNECAPAVRAEVMCKVGKETSKLMRQAIEDAEKLPLPDGPRELKAAKDQDRLLFA